MEYIIVFESCLFPLFDISENWKELSKWSERVCENILDKNNGFDESKDVVKENCDDKINNEVGEKTDEEENKKDDIKKEELNKFDVEKTLVKMKVEEEVNWLE